MPNHRSPGNAKARESDRRSAKSAEPTLSQLPRWKLEDAKARFSQLVRLARTAGPQRVTHRGEDAVVVLSVEEFSRLSAAEPAQPSLVHFLRTSGLGDIDVTRDEDRGREVVL